MSDETEVLFCVHKMSWLEIKVRRWWMQRQLWKSYKKAIELAWAEYEAALEAGDEELSQKCFERCIGFRRVFEQTREKIDMMFEIVPRVDVSDG